MGCFSVYCGISNIGITSEKEEVYILPIISRHKMSLCYTGYQHYLPAMLPILATYNEYGNVQNIIKDDNTQLIENYFNITIEDFVKHLIDNNHSSVGDIINNEKLDELKDYDYMWVLKSVYDELTNNYQYKYAKYDIDNNNISNWRNKSEKEKLNDFYYLFGNNKMTTLLLNMEKYILPEKEVSEIYNELVEINLLNKYRVCNEYLKPENFEIFADRLVSLHNVQLNIFYISKQFTPFINYITPQGADKKYEEKILRIFLNAAKTKQSF
jgi:hypothetical protein